MKKRSHKLFITAFSLLAAFILWTTLICLVDVQPIGPLESSVGFATFNRFVHNLTGIHMLLYTITDWLGLVPILVGLLFSIYGLTQGIKGHSIQRVDRNILLLGIFYAVVIAAYVFFEKHVINYRPVLIDGVLEASYPSSTTLLVLCVMPTAVSQLRNRIKAKNLQRFISAAVTVFTLFMVVGRLVSGVHWFTDIVGGVLLSAGLVTLYYAVSKLNSISGVTQSHRK